jgi:hypothetical protein
MAFERYLGEKYARPPVAAAVGYLTSIAVHGPPLALFVSTWLTHSLLIGYSGPMPTRVRMVPGYQVPISMTQAAAALGDGPGSDGARKKQRRRGLPGRSGRTGRRGLVTPRTIRPLNDAAVAEANSFLAWLDSIDGPSASGGAGGDGTAARGAGGGERGDGKNSGGGGKWSSAGGGIGPPTVMVGTPAPALAAAAIKTSRPPPAKGLNRSGAGKDDGPSEDVAEEDDVAAPPAPGRPQKASYLSESVAAYYRTYEVFPGLPESFWWGGASSYLLVIEVCVSTDGSVSTVTFQQGAKNNEDVDQLVASAIRSWRYRPRVVGGSPRPFCHPIGIEYTRGLRSFTR